MRLSQWVFLVALSFTLHWHATAVSNGDFQIWNYNGIKGHLTKHLDLYTELNFRWQNSGSQLYYNHEHIELQFHPTDYFQIAPGYRQAWHLNTSPSKTWTTEFQPNLNFYFFWTVKGFDFAHRSRIAYRIFQGGSRNWQYRDLFSFYKLVSDKSLPLRVFAQEELFFTQHVSGGLSEIRVSLGLNIGVFKKINMEIGYRKRFIKMVNTWRNQNILLLNAFVYF